MYLYLKQNRESTEWVFKVKSREKTRHALENWSQQSEHKQVPKWWDGTKSPEG